MDGPTPDRAFMADLKRLDKALGIKFNGEHFVITYKVPNGSVNIWRVVAGDGGFRQPDHRDIEILQQSNIERESPEEKQKRVEQYMEAIRAADRKRSRENIRDWTKDGKIQLQRAFENVQTGGSWSSPKQAPNPAFRRIPIIGGSQ
jgi:hypothetical protein